MPSRKVLTKTDEAGTVAVTVTVQQKVRVWMQVIVSLVLLITGIFFLIDPAWLPHFDESMKRIAAGWIGAVVGYWLS